MKLETDVSLLRIAISSALKYEYYIWCQLQQPSSLHQDVTHLFQQFMLLVEKIGFEKDPTPKKNKWVESLVHIEVDNIIT